MTAQADRLHVTFTHSAAGSLKLALARLNLVEKVVAHVDDLSIGPIEPGDSAQRAEWEEAELGGGNVITNANCDELFWTSVTNWSGRLVVWMSSRCGLELCGLHALVSRLPHASIEVVDVAEVAFRKANGDPAPSWGQSFSIVSDDRIIEHKLIDLAVPLDDAARASIRARWKRLGEEGAALRVLTEQGLVSEPITYFDDRIRARITNDWQSCARVVGDTMGTVWSGRLQEFHSDTFMFCRLLALIDYDEFEGQNDEELWSMHRSQVRRWRRGEQ